MKICVCLCTFICVYVCVYMRVSFYQIRLQDMIPPGGNGEHPYIVNAIFNPNDVVYHRVIQFYKRIMYRVCI